MQLSTFASKEEFLMRTSNLLRIICSSEMIIFSLQDKLQGMLFRECFGWQDVYEKYCVELVVL